MVQVNPSALTTQAALHPSPVRTTSQLLLQSTTNFDQQVSLNGSSLGLLFFRESAYNAYIMMAMYMFWMARAGKEIIRRLTGPELREIVREELSTALKPLAVKIDEMDKRLTAKIDELDKRLSSRIDELDKRLVSEISMLRSELQYA
jgi:flagellar capping protein FliD